MTTLLSRVGPLAENVPTRNVEVRHSSVHGDGVFATRALRAGQRVGDYGGRRYAPGQDHEDWDGGMTYLFGLSDGTTIDGAQGGNSTRHLNHACAPSVEAFERRRRDGSLTLTIRTLRRIGAGEELFLDYSLVIAGNEHPSDYPCDCGVVTCRGSMAAQVTAVDTK